MDFKLMSLFWDCQLYRINLTNFVYNRVKSIAVSLSSDRTMMFQDKEWRLQKVIKMSTNPLTSTTSGL